MGTETYKSTYWAYGTTSYNTKTSTFGAGRDASNKYYYAYVRFPVIPSRFRITKMTLNLYRNDTYQAVTLKFGGAKSSDFGATLSFSKNFSVSSGTGWKKFDLTQYARTIQNFGSIWAIHISHGSGTYSYAVFKSSSTSYMYIDIEYSQATVRYYNGTAWVECNVYYRTATAWVQCAPYYYKDGTWVMT